MRNGTASLIQETSLVNALSLLRSTVGENEAVVTNDPFPMVKADQAQLRQVFLNLISNVIISARFL